MLFSVVIATLLSTVISAAAEKRVALVIGNSAYRFAPTLVNPRNDAEDIDQSLKSLGFETVVATDLDRAAMNNALDRFSRVVHGADIALVFYAGHGMQFLGKNYLLPVDARLASAEDVNKFRLVPLDDIFEMLMPAQRRLVILDACRNNPVEEDLKRRLASLAGASRDAYLSRGLGRVPASNGLIVAYATQANDVAADGAGRNSPFTAALLKHVATPNVDVRQMLFHVQDEVDRQTNGRQRPELSLSPIREFRLKGTAVANVPPQGESRPVPPVAPQPPAFDPRAMELSFWESVRNSTSISTIQTYLDRYPNGTFASLARMRVQELQRSAAVTTAPPVPPPNILPPAPPVDSLIPRTTQQPSVDCARPNEPIEHLICADADLAEWDGRMGQIYRAKLNDGRNRDSFRREQREWINRRDAECRVPRQGNWTIAQLTPLKSCMLRMTRTRVGELNAR